VSSLILTFAVLVRRVIIHENWPFVSSSIAFTVCGGESAKTIAVGLHTPFERIAQPGPDLKPCVRSRLPSVTSTSIITKIISSIAILMIIICALVFLSS
jgi:hypothetical protein